MDDFAVKEQQSNIDNMITELREINRREEDDDRWPDIMGVVSDDPVFEEAKRSGLEYLKEMEGKHELRSTAVSRRRDVRLVQRMVTDRIVSWRMVLRRLFNNLRTKGGTK